MTATLKIGQKERDTLHWLMCRRLFILGQDPPGLARKEGVGTDELAGEFGEDLRLMEDLGWEVEGEHGPIVLTMPADSLARTLKRLRRDARRAPCEERHELEAKDSDPERWERFRQAVDACEELLDLLDSPHREEDEEPDSVAWLRRACSYRGKPMRLRTDPTCSIVSSSSSPGAIQRPSSRPQPSGSVPADTSSPAWTSSPAEA